MLESRWLVRLLPMQERRAKEERRRGEQLPFWRIFRIKNFCFWREEGEREEKRGEKLPVKEVALRLILPINVPSSVMRWVWEVERYGRVDHGPPPVHSWFFVISTDYDALWQTAYWWCWFHCEWCSFNGWEGERNERESRIFNSDLSLSLSLSPSISQSCACFWRQNFYFKANANTPYLLTWGYIFSGA